MSKRIFIIFVAAILAANSEAVFSQKRSIQKKANGKTQKTAVTSAKKTASVNDEETFQLKLQETLKVSENWKEYVFVKDSFKVSFPRKPVLRQESFYDEFLGKVSLSLYLSMGNDALFTAGSFRLPFSINDDAVLRKLYQDIARDFLKDDEIETTGIRDIQISGKLGLEIDGVNRKNPSEKTKMRIFLLNKQVFYNVVTPLPPVNLSARQLSASQTKVENETNDFFNSFAEVTSSVSSIVQPVSPLFKSTFVVGTYKSEYFDFTIKIPQDWRLVSQDDVSGMRESGREIVKQNSTIKVPTSPGARRNLFTFSSKPLGAEKNILFACNLLKRPSPEATVLELSNLAEKTLEQVRFYTITKKTHKLILGNTEFVGFEAKGIIGNEEFRQNVYYCLRKDYALGFVMTYYTEEEKVFLLDSLSSLKFGEQ